MIIAPVPEEEATGAVAEFYEADRKRIGYVASYTKAMALNPEAKAAFEELTRAIATGMGMRRYELVTLAAAKACRSEHCRLAHGLRSLNYIDADELTALADDHHDAGLTELEVAIMDFAEKVSGDSASIDRCRQPAAARPRPHRSRDRGCRARGRGAQLLRTCPARARGHRRSCRA